MTFGALAYFIGSAMSLSADTKAGVLGFIEWLQPVLLFIMLFVAFCKVSPKALKPRRWHLWLLLTQTGLFSLCCWVLWMFPQTSSRLVLEGFMLAVICPTATACAVVTQKLGGDSATTTAYTILVNLTVAVVIPFSYAAYDSEKGSYGKRRCRECHDAFERVFEESPEAP